MAGAEGRARARYARRGASTTQTEIVASAVALRPHLLAHAFELSKNRADAEDLVQDAFLKLLTKPPHPRSPAELRHWMRTMLRNATSTVCAALVA